MRRAFLLIVVVILARPCVAAEDGARTSLLRVLYVGNKDSARERAFARFLDERFILVDSVSRRDFDPESARAADVVLLDWSPSDLGPEPAGGRSVAAGMPVFLAIAAGHRMPSVWDDPERFEPDRFLPPREEDRRTPYALATFGGGPRICLGINFAQVEIMALVAHVQRHYRLTRASNEPIREFGGLLPALPDGIPVRVRRG